MPHWIFLLTLVGLIAACAGGDDAAFPESDDQFAVGDTSAERGQALYAANCARCHGDTGAGANNWKVRDPDGALPPPPLDATGHTWHHGDGLLAGIIREGCAIYQVGTAPCNMPAFPDLTDFEVVAILSLLKSWWGPDERGFQEAMSLEDRFPAD